MIRFLPVFLLFSATALAQPAKNDPLLAVLNARKTAEAENLLGARFANTPKNDTYHYWSGRILFQKNDFESATAAFEKAIEAKPAVSEYHLWLGRAAGSSAQKASVFRQPGLAKRAKQAWEKALALDPQSIDARNDLVSYHLQAPSIMGGSVETAKKLAAEIATLNPWQGFFAQTRVFSSQKDNAALETHYKNALVSWPDSSQIHQQYGLFLSAQNRNDEAWKHFTRAEILRPDEWGPTYQLVKMAANSGKNIPETLPKAEKLAKNPPTPNEEWQAYFHFRHGQLLEHAGRKKEAETAFRQALALKSDFEDAKKALQRVK